MLHTWHLLRIESIIFRLPDVSCPTRSLKCAVSRQLQHSISHRVAEWKLLVAKLLTTMGYVHTADKRLHEVVDKLSAIVTIL
jgi:hypothetical protein